MKLSKNVLLICLLLWVAKTQAAESKVATYPQRKVVTSTRDGIKRARCPAGECECNIKITAKDDGTFSSDVYETKPTPESENGTNTIELDLSPYIFSGATLDEIFNLVVNDLLFGEGVTTMQ